MKFLDKYIISKIAILIFFAICIEINGCRLTQKPIEEVNYQDKPIKTNISIKYASGDKTIRLIGIYGFFPTWSSDGKSIFFLSSHNLFRMDVSTGGIKRIKSDLLFDVDIGQGGFSVSSDEKKIATVRMSGEHQTTRNIYIFSIENNSIQQLTSAVSNNYNPTWSPDGKRIAFVSEKGGYSHIYIMDEAGKVLKKLTDGTSDNTKPAFLKDGNKIAFVSFKDGNAEIYTMNSDGSDQRNLTNNPANDIDPNWSPDSQKIVFSSNRNGNYDIYCVDTNSLNVERLTQDSGHKISPMWSPDGSSIVYHLYHGSL